jgi:hypothetical protein
MVRCIKLPIYISFVASRLKGVFQFLLGDWFPQGVPPAAQGAQSSGVPVIKMTGISPGSAMIA